MMGNCLPLKNILKDFKSAEEIGLDLNFTIEELIELVHRLLKRK